MFFPPFPFEDYVSKSLHNVNLTVCQRFHQVRRSVFFHLGALSKSVIWRFPQRNLWFAILRKPHAIFFPGLSLWGVGTSCNPGMRCKCWHYLSSIWKTQDTDWWVKSAAHFLPPRWIPDSSLWWLCWCLCWCFGKRIILYLSRLEMSWVWDLSLRSDKVGSSVQIDHLPHSVDTRNGK